ncbi:MAG: patatin-like phospholipase PlpD [Armatimonadaceae bacterium]
MLAALLVWFGFAGAGQSMAQDQDTAPSAPAARPRIGLALGGGAALGIAHVGVLQWMEENRIPVDVIAGTSMGGLVGGGYATGMRADELYELFLSLDWRETLNARVPYTYLSYRRKEDRRAYPTSIELGLKNGIQFPKGLNPIPGVSLLLSQIAAKAGPLENFSALPIPFRCTAINLRNGELVVLSEGPLATALRATMAIPGIFPPVERDGAVLVDGGFLDNVPADQVRQMGADVVIAVDVTEEFQEEEDFGSALGVLSRTLSVLSRQPVEQGLREADLLIRPDLKPFNLESWASAEELMARGRAAAEQNADTLRRYALSEPEWQAHLAARLRERQPVIVPTFVQVEGAASSLERNIVQRLRPFLGKPLEPKTIGEVLTQLGGDGLVAALIYAPVRRDNQNGLKVIVTEKTYGPPILNFAPQISSRETLSVTTVLGGRITFFNTGFDRTETRLDVAIGSINRLALEYFLPLNRSQVRRETYFVAPQGRFSEYAQPLFQSGDRLADYRLRESLWGIDAGVIWGRTDELRIGWLQGWQSGTELVGGPDVPRVNGSYRAARLRYTFDGQNAAVLPSRGLRLIGETRRIESAPGTDRSYYQGELRASWFTPIRPQESFFIGGAAGTNSVANPSPFTEFSLGGTLNLSAYQIGEISGRNYLFGVVGYIREVSPGSFLLGGRTSVGTWLEVGNAWGSTFRQNPDALPVALTGSLVVESVLGPILVGGSIGQGGRSRLFVTIGQFLN